MGKRILSLDGGGIRGIFTLQILRHIEKRSGKRIIELFDLIVGTSTGGFIAGCLVAGKTIDEIEEEYWKVSKSFTDARPSVLTYIKRVIFGSVIDPCVIYNLLTSFLGKITLNELPESPRLLIVASKANGFYASPFLFRNRPINNSSFPYIYNISLADTLRACTSAPTFYPNYKIGSATIVDGAIHSNNPSLFAICEVSLMSESIDLLVSIGSGTLEAGEAEAEAEAEVVPESIFTWIYSVLNMSTDTENTQNLAKGILGSKLIRINPPTGNCYLWENDRIIIDNYRDKVAAYCQRLNVLALGSEVSGDQLGIQNGQ
jgi:patatin-like phospholipase/acyl hydrolase